MNYGEIVQFECHIHTGKYSGLNMFFGNALVYPEVSMSISTVLDLRREFSVEVEHCYSTNCSTNATLVGRVWILINSKTIPVINFFWCRVHHGSTFEDSVAAHIEVQYPECTPTHLLIQNQPTIIPVTSSFTPHQEFLSKSASISVMVVDPEPCSIGELSSHGMLLDIIIYAALLLINVYYSRYCQK